MTQPDKQGIEFFDEECLIEQGWVDTWPDGAQRYTCELSIEAYLEDGTRLAGKVTLELVKATEPPKVVPT